MYYSRVSRRGLWPLLASERRVLSYLELDRTGLTDPTHLVL
jgi:hypothetical protein